jgi:hypothetical protein
MPKARGHSLQILDVTNHHLVVQVQVAFFQLSAME